MMRLDHNRAIAQLANKLGEPVSDVTNMTVWGNHSTTQYPDLVNAQGRRRQRRDAVDDEAWIASEFIPRWRSAAPRSSTHGARRAPRRPPTPQSITSATGCTALPRRTGSRWAYRPTAPMALMRVWSPAIPAHVRAGSGGSRRGSRCRVLTRPDRRQHRRAARGARRRQPAWPDLSVFLKQVLSLRR